MRMSKKVSDLLFATKMWFIARGIEQGDVNKQGLKLIEEMGSWFQATLKQRRRYQRFNRWCGCSGDRLCHDGRCKSWIYFLWP